MYYLLSHVGRRILIKSSVWGEQPKLTSNLTEIYLVDVELHVNLKFGEESLRRAAKLSFSENQLSPQLQKTSANDRPDPGTVSGKPLS